MSLADELERLGNATESGDWYADSLGYIPSAGVTDVHSGDRRVAEFMPKADAALIVALRNNLPAIIEALRAQEWRDIETAPRDGTRFILASTVVHEPPDIWHFNAARSAWVNDRGHYRPADDIDPEIAPVWSPLPKPPAQEQKP
jgi:hypothetical protein